MGFWSKLAKIGGVAAAPFTGGLSIPIGNAIGEMTEGVGRGAGAAAQGAAQNRGSKAELMMDAQSDLERQLLAREEEKRSAQMDAYRKAMYGANNIQWQQAQRPAGVPMIQFTRGPGDMGRMAGGELYSQAMRRMLQPDLVNPTGMPEYKPLMDPAQMQKEFQKSLSPGFWEKLGGYGGFAGPAVGSFMKLMAGKQDKDQMKDLAYTIGTGGL